MRFIDNILERIRDKRREAKREAIERRYERIFLRTCDMFGDDRVRSFQWFVVLQKQKNDELRKLS